MKKAPALFFKSRGSKDLIRWGRTVKDDGRGGHCSARNAAEEERAEATPVAAGNP